MRKFTFPLKIFAITSCVFALTLIGVPHFGKAEGAAAQRRAVMISIDGLPPDLYLNRDKYGLYIPNLLELMEQGSYAEAVEGVYPSVTYPSHTTLVTGRRPREHGIFTNYSSRQAGKDPGVWFWYADAIRVPTLWDLARKKGLKTGAVSWPVSVGADVDWLLPEIHGIGDTPRPVWEVVAENSSPQGLMEEVFKVSGEPRTGEIGDSIRARAAIHILKKYRPHLLLLHVFNLDGAHHQTGPGSPEARKMLEKLDGFIGLIRAAVDEIGLSDETAFFIVSDHGFMRVTHTLSPNVLLAKAGLLTTEENGKITGGKIATVGNGGSFFIYWPTAQDETLRKQVDEALRPMREQGLLWAVFGRKAAADLFADEDVRLILEAPTGYSFSGKTLGKWVAERPSVGGVHGYLPTRPEMATSFIAAGPGLRKAGSLGRIRMIEIAPTVAQYLGIYEPGFGHTDGIGEVLR